MDTPRKIKVLRIIGECKTGGTETIALNYYKNLDHDAIAMDFLFYGESLPRFNLELEANGDKVINVVDYTRDLIGSIREIRNVVKTNNYDIVHAQLNTLNMFPLLGAYLGGAKIRIAANHSTANLKYETKKSILKYVLRPTTKIFATHYAACSRYAGEWCFGRNAVKKGRLKVIHNAINLDDFNYSVENRENVRRENNWNGKFVIGHAGRFTKQKNHKFIVDVFAAVHRKYPDALLVFAGDGHLMESVKQQVHSLGLDDAVQFLGTRFDVNQLMQGMDVFLFPSLYEGFGNVITEAQALGLHSIISDQVPEEVVLTSYVDVLPLDADVSTWANKVLEYNNEYKHADTHELLRSSGYDINVAASELSNWYVELLEDYNLRSVGGTA